MKRIDKNVRAMEMRLRTGWDLKYCLKIIDWIEQEVDIEKKLEEDK